jgi:hypothetical protein
MQHAPALWQQKAPQLASVDKSKGQTWTGVDAG